MDVKLATHLTLIFLLFFPYMFWSWFDLSVFKILYQTCHRAVFYTNKAMLILYIRMKFYLLSISVTYGSSDMTIINRCVVSQQLWQAKERPLVNDCQCRVQIKICKPSPVMVTSPYE